MKVRTCLNCDVDLSNEHSNRKRCEQHALLLRKKPVANLSNEQISEALRLRGKMPVEEIAKLIGTSRSALRRFARDKEISFSYFYYDNAIKENVIKFYEKHGKRKTQEEFPGVCVRSIIERSYGKFSPRQTKWTDSQIADVVRMSCFVSFDVQAKIFNRPYANAGSIKSVWVKRLTESPTDMHGLPKWKAKLFVKETCPHIKLPLLINTAGRNSTMRIFL